MLNAEARQRLAGVRLPAKVRTQLESAGPEPVLTRAEFTRWLDEQSTRSRLTTAPTHLGAAALAAYHVQQEFPIVDLLVCDDAPQYTQLTEALAGCWVHDGRHYKKLMPVVAAHRQALNDFFDRYWDFYAELLAYKQQPTAAEADRLSDTFNQLFSKVTDYDALDERSAKTRAKKDTLLMVLKHPGVALAQQCFGTGGPSPRP